MPSNKVMQHCFGSSGSGGPVGALERLQQYSGNVYPEIRQLVPAGGINAHILYSFYKKIRACKPSLLHVRGLGAEGFHGALAARLAGVPNVLVSIHGTQRDLKSPKNRIRRWIVVNVLERLTLSLATHIATVYDGALNRDFLKPYRHKLVGAVPNGLAVPSPKDDEARFSLRSHLSIELDSIVGICVSRLVPDKGYFFLAEALEKIGADTPCDFIIVGGGDDNGEIRRRFSRISGVKVHFTGQQQNVMPFLRAADFYVQSSLHENLSNSLLEAMAAGLPVIASSVGGTSEVLSKGGGILVPPGNSDALGEAMIKLRASRDLRDSFGVAGRKNIEENYSIESMVNGWEKIYEKILEGK